MPSRELMNDGVQDILTECSNLLREFDLIIKPGPLRTSGPVNAHLTPGPGIYF